MEEGRAGSKQQRTGRGCPCGWSLERADLGWGAQASSWWGAEYLGLGCETLGLASWMPGVWREAWAGGRQLGVGGWDRKWGPGRRGPGESQAGEGVIFSGNCSFSGEGAEDTHVPCHKLTHVCTHASCTCEQWMQETGALGPLGPESPCPLGLLACPQPPQFCGSRLSPQAPASPVPWSVSGFFVPPLLGPGFLNVCLVLCFSGLLPLACPSALGSLAVAPSAQVYPESQLECVGSASNM